MQTAADAGGRARAAWLPGAARDRRTGRRRL